MVEHISYTPPSTLKQFIKWVPPAQLFYAWTVGPYGSGKTTAMFFKLCHMAKLQAPGKDGVRRTRAVIVRNTRPQLKDTTLVSWNYWFKDGQAGSWKASDYIFLLRFDDVECEVMFRPLDTPDDVARVLSLEVTFALIDEFVQIPKEIIDALSARLGRFPAAKDGGATNWGMWGVSNPSTEDNWWFDYLHNEEVVERFTKDGVLGDPDVRIMRRRMLGLPETTNVHYYLQPPGNSPDAENWENLPGKRDYYVNQAKGKSEAWVKQFIEAEWGFSIAGKPVLATFKPDLHIAKTRLQYNPMLPLVIGLDPGLEGSALIFGQEDMWGRLLILGESCQSGYGAQRLIDERLRPYLRRRFPEAKIIIAPDPAAQNRAQTDEKSVVDVFRRYYTVKAESNNRLPLRIGALEYYTTKLTETGPALLIDPFQCPMLVRALKGGWRYAMDTKRGGIKGTEPEDNPYTHPADAAGYLARYFFRSIERNEKYRDVPGAKRFVPPRSFGPSYHQK
jgi:hypothetical protein